MASSTWHSGKTGIMETEENQWLPGARGTVLYYKYSRSLWDYQNSELYPKSAAFEVWRDGSGVNSTDYSSRVEFPSPTLCGLQPHNHPGDPMPSLTSVITSTHMVYTHPNTQTHTHTHNLSISLSTRDTELVAKEGIWSSKNNLHKEKHQAQVALLVKSAQVPQKK